MVRQNAPVTLSDVAVVVEGSAVQRGLAHASGRDVVSSRVIKQFGSDTVSVTRAVRAALDEAQKTLPPGVRIRSVYDQSELIDHALSSVHRAILIGAVLVVIVLLLLLGDVRSAVIVTVTLPTSVILAGMVMYWFGAGINTMTLGGLAIAVGILVDAAIIMTENIHHRLSTADGDLVHVVLPAAIEVGRPIAFATVIIMAVFLPLLLMTGIEGRLYRPLALTVVSAMGASLVLSLTLVPALCAWFLKPARGDSDVVVIRTVKRLYVPALDWAFRHAGLIRVLALAVTIPAFVGFYFVGVQTVLPPEASLGEVDRVNTQVEDVLTKSDGVAFVSRRSGRSEETEDPMPHTLSDVLVTLKAPSEREGSEEIETKLRAALEDVPGVAVRMAVLGDRSSWPTRDRPKTCCAALYDSSHRANSFRKRRRMRGRSPGTSSTLTARFTISQWRTRTSSIRSAVWRSYECTYEEIRRRRPIFAKSVSVSGVPGGGSPRLSNTLVRA